MHYRFTLFSLLLLCAAGCAKTANKSTTLSVRVHHKVDSAELRFHAMDYVCAAGYPYRLSKLQYYLSNFVFTRNDGSRIFRDEVFYVDAAEAASNLLVFPDLPEGDFRALSFLVGLDSLRNVPNGLPATVANSNMIWPPEMGGGYHFLKLEGIYQDSVGSHGFAVHLGKSANAVAIALHRTFAAHSGAAADLDLTMNLNEWFRNPAVYDFNSDGGYSMSSDAAMQKLTANGKDVFD